MRCQRVLWSLSWRHSQRCGASRPFSSQPLRWSSSRAPEDSFKQFYWDEENVLYLYAIQRVLRDGKQHVDITWQLGEHGERLAGSGRARSKKQARREAAKKLLKLLPVGKEAEIQMRKQMLQGLRYKLSAEVVEDGVAGAVNNDRGLQQIYRVLWKVPRPQGRAPAEVSAEGRGGTVAEAQADAWENLYIQARRKNLHAAASQAVYEEREERKRQQLEDAAEQRQQQVNEGMSILTSEAASELAVRHNTVVQRLRIQAKDEMAAHEAGYHCVLHWSWEDPSGESRSARSSGLGSSKRQARGEAMQKMLAEQGFGSFEATALNDAARVRGLAKAGDPQSTPLACSFMLNWPTSHWGLVLIEVWQSALARQDLAAVQELGAAVQSVSDGLGPQLWESLLDAPAHVACGKTAMEALKALQGVSLIASGFPSYAHRDYFQHFRLLTAMERIGANQAMVEELRSQSDVMYLRMRQQNCVLPYLTLAPASSGNAHWSPSIFTELRQGDVVYLQSGERDHLAVITSIVKEDGKQKLTLRCHTLSLDDVDEEWFDVYGLESEVTTLRCISALWSASQPHASLEERPATQLMLNREMTKILVESFLPEGLTKAREVARSLPPGCDPGSMDQRLQMLQKSIPSHVNLSESQMRSVQSALQQRLTLIHGPPGTGKTTAAVSVLSAWRSLGDRILCAADSNVAADNLHQNLQKWGVKSYRFSPTEMHQTGERATAYQRMLAIQDAIGSFQIVVTTCASAGHELLRGYNFPRVLIDESTQSIEPSTLLPIINGCSHLVLIGDHRQLPPTVISDDARRLGLDRSLFARLAEPKANAVVEPLLLNEQRRMHPSIAEFPNRHFYNGLVQDQVSSRPPIPGVQFPQQDATRVLLVDCAAETAEEQYGTSWRNVAEVQAVRDFVAHVLTPSRHVPKPLEPEQIVVLTPYLQQKELLQSALEKAKLQVRVSTVDGFQGAEADLVLFSAVRANLSGRLGFLRDTRRANVALTRARRGLVVFADATTLRESKGSVWATWLEWLEARDGVRELDELYQDVLI